MAKLSNFKFFKKDENLVIIKTGFSSWALLLSWLWYIYYGLWQYRLLLITLEIISIILVFSESIFLAGIFLVLIRLYASLKGNSLIEKKLLNQGFILEENIRAADKKRALEQYNNLRSHIIEY